MDVQERYQVAKTNWENAIGKINKDWFSFINYEVDKGQKRLSYLILFTNEELDFLKNMQIQSASWDFSAIGDIDVFRIHLKYRDKEYLMKGDFTKSDEECDDDYYEVSIISEKELVNPYEGLFTATSSGIYKYSSLHEKIPSNLSSGINELFSDFLMDSRLKRIFGLQENIETIYLSCLDDEKEKLR